MSPQILLVKEEDASAPTSSAVTVVGPSWVPDAVAITRREISMAISLESESCTVYRTLFSEGGELIVAPLASWLYNTSRQLCAAPSGDKESSLHLCKRVLFLCCWRRRKEAKLLLYGNNYSMTLGRRRRVKAATSCGGGHPSPPSP